jgi:hypothetical protein
MTQPESPLSGSSASDQSAQATVLRRRNRRTAWMLLLLVLGFVVFGLWHLGAFR